MASARWEQLEFGVVPRLVEEVTQELHHQIHQMGHRTPQVVGVVKPESGHNSQLQGQAIAAVQQVKWEQLPKGRLVVGLKEVQMVAAEMQEKPEQQPKDLRQVGWMDRLEELEEAEK